jgi:hypothetical protein
MGGLGLEKVCKPSFFWGGKKKQGGEMFFGKNVKNYFPPFNF